jgi:hypothetical protein
VAAVLDSLAARARVGPLTCDWLVRALRHRKQNDGKQPLVRLNKGNSRELRDVQLRRAIKEISERDSTMTQFSALRPR